MTRTRRCLVGTIVAAGILLATAVAAVAETYTLTLKRRETKSADIDANVLHVLDGPAAVLLRADGGRRKRPMAAGRSGDSRRRRHSSGSSPRSPSTSPRIRSAAWSSSGRRNTPSPWTRRPRQGRRSRTPKETTAKANVEAGGKLPRRRLASAGEAARGVRRSSRLFPSRISPTTGSISISITTAT